MARKIQWTDIARGTLHAVLTLLVICAICALIVTYVIRLQSTFWQSMVFSICIGGATMLLIRAGYALIWRYAKPSNWGMALLIAVATPLGFMLGSVTASRLLHLPVDDFGLRHLHANAGLVILTVLASVFSTWFFWTQARLQRLNATTAAIEQRATKARLQMLQAQIEPHMLFNTLANLQGLIALDPIRAQRLLDQLIVYLRSTLSSSRVETTTLAQEFELMQAYLEVMSVRMGTRLHYTLELPPALRSIALPPMLLQPLVENAIKHGVEPNIAGGSITVRAGQHGERLMLTVSDTGRGLEAAPIEPSGQLGVANVKERLQMLYQDRATFSLLPNTPSGAVAQITLPLLP